jgi:hypothetical protein
MTRAKNHDLITFAALSRLVGVRVPLNLSPMLDRIHNEDIEARRPSLAAIVVSAEDLTMPRAWRDNWDLQSWTKERVHRYRYYGH